MKMRALIVWLFLTGIAYAQTLAPNGLPIDTSIHYGQLANGMTYYVKANAEPPQRAGFRLVVKAGSLQEEADQLGLAHFVEHMAFNGTAHFAKNTLIDFLERNGSRFGADLNASTSFGQTIYKLNVQTDKPAVVDTALQILVDWAGAVTFDPEEVDNERGIIRAEWRSRLSSQQRLQQQTWPVLLQNSRYAERFPIGSMDIIDTVATQRLIDYYKRWYQPRRMAIIAVGDFDATQMLSTIKARFSSLENTDATQSLRYGLDETSRQSYVIATDPEAPFTRWQIEYQLDSIPTGPSTKAQIREDLLYSLYGRMLNKRLAELREKAIQPFTFAQAGFRQLPARYRSFSISGFTTSENVLPALRVIATEVQRVALHGFTLEELELEKSAYLHRIKQFVKELDKQPTSRYLGRFVDLYLNNEPTADLHHYHELTESLLATIQTTDIQALSQQWQQTQVVTTTISTSEEQLAAVPDSIQFYRTLDSIWHSSPLPYAQEALPETLLASLPPFPKQLPQLVAHDTVVDVYTYLLSNGTRIHLKPTDFKADQIIFRALSPGGLSLVSDTDYPSALHATNLLDASGLGNFSKSKLYDMLADKQVNVGAYIGHYEEGLGGNSNQADLESCFQLIHLYFTHVRFDSLATLNYQQKRREIMERIDTDPRSAFGRLMIDLQYDYHLRRPNTTTQELDQIDRETAHTIYKERFANPADFEFVFVGNFNTDSLLLLTERYVGSLPSEDKRESWQAIGPTYTDQLIDTIVVAGQTPKAEVQLVWHGDFPFANAQQRYNFVSMRKLLDIRLREELREEMGGVYGVRLNGGIKFRPDSSYYMRIRFNTEPDSAQVLIDAALNVIQQLADGQIKQSDIEKIQESQRKVNEEYFRQNRSWLSQLTTRIARQESWQGFYPSVRDANVDGLRKEALQQAIIDYLSSPPQFKMILQPEIKD